MGLSRDTFYRYQSAVEAGGVEALIDANRKKPNLRNRVDDLPPSSLPPTPLICSTPDLSAYKPKNCYSVNPAQIQLDYCMRVWGIQLAPLV